MERDGTMPAKSVSMPNQNNPSNPNDTSNRPAEKRDGERPMEQKPGTTERRDEKRDENKQR